jgi:hypothetical protein
MPSGDWIVKWAANIVMERRARALFLRVSPHLPLAGTIADIGSGTGHNAEQIRHRTALIVDEYDVADLHWVGPGPTLISDDSLPARDHCFASLLLLFTLQYPESVSRILHEVRRVLQGSVIVLQSTYTGRLGLFVLRLRESIWGKIAFHLAVLMKLITCANCPVLPRRFFTRQQLIEEFHRSGFVVREIHPSNWPGLNVSRDLFVLEAKAT